MRNSARKTTAAANIWAFGLIERFDCLEWVEWATAKCGSELPIYLCGVSMGATTVLMAAGLELPENVHGITADCGFTSPHAIWENTSQTTTYIFPTGFAEFSRNEMFRQKLNMGNKRLFNG